MENWYRTVFYWIFSISFFEDKQQLKSAIQLAVDYPFPVHKEAFSKQVEAINAFDCRASLPEITCPTLIVDGGKDLLFPGGKNRHVLEVIPDAQVVVIEEAAHSIHMEKPNEFSTCVLEFLRNK